MRNSSKSMALGGVFAALALVIMNLGGLIPVATYVCPMLCMLMNTIVFMACGNRVAWAWYGAVSILSLLLSPNKEAAAVFLALGYYPIMKPWLDTKPLRWLWKGIIFNGATIALYWLLIQLMGMDELGAEFEEMGNILLAVLLLLGNATFFMLDKLLGILFARLPMRKWRS